MYKPKKLKDIPSVTVWNTCIDLGIFRHASDGSVTLSHGFLKLVLTLYEKYESLGEFKSKQAKLVGAIRTAFDLVVENCKTTFDREIATACGLLGFLTLLRADAAHDGEKKVVQAASSAAFNLKAVVRFLKRMIQAREKAGLVGWPRIAGAGVVIAEPKVLKEYPVGIWFEAADECEYCKSKYEVRIHKVDKTGRFGTVEWRIHHKPDCPEVTEYLEGAPVTEISSMDFAGWEYMENPVAFKGKLYYPLKSRANIGPCLECGRLIVGAPLILFIEEGRKGELDFCWSCAKKLGILEMMRT